MRTPPLVDDRAIGVGARAGGTEKVPAAIEDRAVDADVGRLRRGEDVLRAGDAVLHHPCRVLANPVVDPRRRDAVAVLPHRIERDAVMLLWQVLADRGQAKAMAVEAAEGGVMACTPGQEPLGFAGDGLGDRPDAAAELERVAAHKAARAVGFVELFAPQ